MSRATRSILRLTPYGLFAIAASAAGTLSIEQLGRLQVYLVTYVAVALLLSLWVLPGLIAALTPIRIGEMFGLTRDALLTAFVAGDLFIVLPALIEASRTLLARHAPDSPEADELPGRPGADVVQFSAHREAPVDQLHPVCRLVRGCRGASRATTRSSRRPAC